MKKLFIILAFVVFAALSLSSCKTAENCPAYSNAENTIEEIA